MSKQPDLFTGLELGHEAAKRAADRAGAEWEEEAYRAFCAYVRDHSIITTEAVRAVNPDISVPTGENRSWGQVAIRAKAAGLVKAIGWACARDPKVHGRAVTVWKRIEP